MTFYNDFISCTINIRRDKSEFTYRHVARWVMKESCSIAIKGLKNKERQTFCRSFYDIPAINLFRLMRDEKVMIALTILFNGPVNNFIIRSHLWIQIHITVGILIAKSTTSELRISSGCYLISPSLRHFNDNYIST